MFFRILNLRFSEAVRSFVRLFPWRSALLLVGRSRDMLRWTWQRAGVLALELASSRPAEFALFLIHPKKISHVIHGEINWVLACFWICVLVVAGGIVCLPLREWG